MTKSALAAVLSLSFALLVLATSGGCFALAAGVGAGAAVAYVRGDLDTTLSANFDRSVRAAQKAMTDLKFAKISEAHDAIQAVLTYRDARDRKIEVFVARETEVSTRLKIRVGTFGEEGLQQEILGRVKSNL
jgi:hypothetical protein